jgi:hypothetical protein
MLQPAMVQVPILRVVNSVSVPGSLVSAIYDFFTYKNVGMIARVTNSVSVPEFVSPGRFRFGGKTGHLTPKEAALLRYLISQDGKTASRKV